MGLAQSFDSEYPQITATDTPSRDPNTQPSHTHRVVTETAIPAPSDHCRNNKNHTTASNNHYNNHDDDRDGPMTMQPSPDRLDQDPAATDGCSVTRGQADASSPMVSSSLGGNVGEDQEEDVSSPVFLRSIHRGSGSMDDHDHVLIVSDNEDDNEEDDEEDGEEEEDEDNEEEDEEEDRHPTSHNSSSNHSSLDHSQTAHSSPYAMDRTRTLLMDTQQPDQQQHSHDVTDGNNQHHHIDANYFLRSHSLSPRHGHGLTGSSLNVSPTGMTGGSASAASKKTLQRTNSSTKKPHSLKTFSSSSSPTSRAACINPAAEINARLDTQVEVRVYPCNNSQSTKKKFTQFMVKPEGVIIQGTNRSRTHANDLGSEYAMHIGRKLQRYELSDTRACQLLVTTHAKSFWVVPAPEAFSRHSGTCRLLGDKKHPVASHVLQVGDFLRVGSVGVVVIETHNGKENRILSEEKIQSIMRDTTNSNGGFLDLAETDDGENSDDSMREGKKQPTGDSPFCYMCFDDEDTEENPLISPCKCRGDTRYVHVNCLRKWHTAEADNQICFLSSVDATCSVCKTTFKSDFKLKDGRLVKLFKSSLEPPYVSLLVATKHEMAQRLFNTRFQLSFSSILKPDGKNSTRPLLLGRSSGSDMVLDYRTVSARHATIRFKNGEFVFTDAGSSNGSYLYLRRPVELTPSQPVQFRLGRSMISMKVVNKWNRRLLRAVRRSGNQSDTAQRSEGDDVSVGSNEEDVRINDGNDGAFLRYLPKRTRDSIMNSLPPPGRLSQQSSQHLDLLHALAYPKKNMEGLLSRHGSSSLKRHFSSEAKTEEGSPENDMTRQIAEFSIAGND